MKALILFTVALMPYLAYANPCSNCGPRRALIQNISTWSAPAMEPELHEELLDYEPGEDSEEDEDTTATYAAPPVARPAPVIVRAGPCQIGSGVQKDLCASINQVRASRGLAALHIDSRMNAVAQRYAEQMARTGTLSHRGPAGDTFDDRLTMGGVRFNAAAENIAAGQRSVGQVIRDWQASPGHSANIYSRSYRRHGFGQYNGYWVHLFAD